MRQRLRRPVQALQCAQDLAQEMPAVRGEMRGFPFPIGQFAFELLLQALDPVADRGLGEVQGRGRAGVAAGASQGGKHPQQADIQIGGTWMSCLHCVHK